MMHFTCSEPLKSEDFEEYASEMNKVIADDISYSERTIKRLISEANRMLEEKLPSD